MTTPDRPTDRPDEQPRSGVRGVIDELLGRNDRGDRDPRDDEDFIRGQRADGAPDGPRDPGNPNAGPHVGGPAGDQRHVDPQGVGPQGVGPQHAGPQHVDPRQVDPRHAGPQGAAPQATGPHGADPHGADPQYGGPPHSGPQRPGPQGTGPQHAAPQHLGPDGVPGGAPAGGPPPAAPDQSFSAGGAPTGRDHGSSGDALTAPVGIGEQRTDRLTSPTGEQHPGAAPGTGGGPGGAADGGPGTGPGNPDAGRAAGSDTDSSGRERLVPAERAQSYTARWDSVKVAFVDEPRQAVTQADALVGELLDELQAVFANQRAGLEQGLDTDATSTEDLRLALRRYRSFFDRLLSL